MPYAEYDTWELAIPQYCDTRSSYFSLTSEPLILTILSSGLLFLTFPYMIESMAWFLLCIFHYLGLFTGHHTKASQNSLVLVNTKIGVWGMPLWSRGDSFVVFVWLPPLPTPGNPYLPESCSFWHTLCYVATYWEHTLWWCVFSWWELPNSACDPAAC